MKSAVPTPLRMRMPPLWSERRAPVAKVRPAPASTVSELGETVAGTETWEVRWRLLFAVTALSASYSFVKRVPAAKEPLS